MLYGFVKGLLAMVASRLWRWCTKTGRFLLEVGMVPITSMIPTGRSAVPPPIVSDGLEREVASLETLADGAALDRLQLITAGDGSLGATVHAYVSGNTEVDISNLLPHQIAWLVGLDGSEKRKLMAAGPGACAIHARGRRSGVVGVPICRPAPMDPSRSTPDREVDDAPGYAPAFAR